MLRDWLTKRTPTWEYGTFTEIPFKDLSSKGYVYFIIDVDNTLATRQSWLVSEDIALPLRDLRSSGYVFGICLVSNVVYRSKNKVARIENIARQLECDYVCAYWPKGKPHKLPFQQALKKLGATNTQTVVIGDQLLTDILGANMMNMCSIAVSPLGPDHFITKPKRLVEKAIRLLRTRVNCN